MNDSEKDQREVRRYILGEMSAPEQQAFETRYFADEELLNELEATRADLMDKWAERELLEADREGLARRLRQLPALHERAEFAQSLQQVFNKPDNDLRPPPVTPAQTQRAKAGSPWLTALLGLLHVSPWTFAGSFVLLSAGLWWWLSPRASRAPVSPSVAQVSPSSSPASVAASAPTIKTVGAVVHPAATGSKRGRTTAALPASLSGAIASFVLSAELVRDVTEPRALTLPAGVRTVRLQLELADLPAQLLRAELQTAAGEIVWQQAGLRAQKIQKLYLVICAIPVTQLENGVYRLRLFRPDQAVEMEYLFRSQKQ